MARSPRIDHVVIAVPNLAATVEEFEPLGFNLTPRASHPDSMGTANQLAQFAANNFIELLEVDRPASVAPPDFDAVPPRFSFGAFLKDYLQRRQGMAALVLTTDDALGDAEDLADAGLAVYEPFDFSRHATLPDGRRVTVGFTLIFVTDPAMPDCLFYLCQNHYPENFWKPQFQNHPNACQGIRAVCITAEDPVSHRSFLETLTSSQAIETADGLEIPLPDNQYLHVLKQGEASGPNNTNAFFSGIDLHFNNSRSAFPSHSQHAGVNLRKVE